MRHSFVSLVVSSLLLGACSEPPKLSGKVTDIFGKPLAGAKVLVKSSNAHHETDPQGSFAFEVTRPATLELRAGLDGYIPDEQSVQVPAEKDQPLPSPVFKLWEIPDQLGFTGMGDGEMVFIKPGRVVSKGNSVKEIHGVRDLPGIKLPKRPGPDRFLFNTRLSRAEISRFDLKLTQLEYQEEATLPGLTGEETITTGLWVASGDVDFTLEETKAEHIYLVSTAETLEPGQYAFQTQSILTETEPESLARFPEEMQTVSVFEIK